MERGTVEWNSGTMEWNSGMVERWNTGMAINDPVPFLRTNYWACALAIDIGMEATYKLKDVLKLYEKEPMHMLLYYS